MFKMFFPFSGTCKLSLCLPLLLYTVSAYYVSGQETNESIELHDFNSQELNSKYDWKLAPAGETAVTILDLFYSYSSKGPIRTMVREKVRDFDKMLQITVGYFFMEQIFMAAISVFGSLCALMFLLMPYFIMKYRRKQIFFAEELSFRQKGVSPQHGWLISEFLIVFLAISIFGAILMYFSSIELNNNIAKAFDFAAHVVNTSYKFKRKMRNHYYFNLDGISQSAFGAIQRMHEVNDEVHEKFMKEINFRIKPISYLIRSVQWDIEYIRKSLTDVMNELKNLTRHTDEKIGNLSDEYFASLNNLKEIFEEENSSKIFGSILYPLLEVTNYSSNASFEVLDKVTKRLQPISELKIAETLQNVTRYFRGAIENIIYDPAELIKELRQVCLDREQKIRYLLSSYLTQIETDYTSKMKNRSLNDIKAVRNRFLNIFQKAYFVL